MGKKNFVFPGKDFFLSAQYMLTSIGYQCINIYESPGTRFMLSS